MTPIAARPFGSVWAWSPPEISCRRECVWWPAILFNVADRQGVTATISLLSHQQTCAMALVLATFALAFATIMGMVAAAVLAYFCWNGAMWLLEPNDGPSTMMWESQKRAEALGRTPMSEEHAWDHQMLMSRDIASVKKYQCQDLTRDWLTRRSADCRIEEEIHSPPPRTRKERQALDLSPMAVEMPRSRAAPEVVLIEDLQRGYAAHFALWFLGFKKMQIHVFSCRLSMNRTTSAYFSYFWFAHDYKRLPEFFFNILIFCILYIVYNIYIYIYVYVYTWTMTYCICFVMTFLSMNCGDQQVQWRPWISSRQSSCSDRCVPWLHCSNHGHNRLGNCSNCASCKISLW